MISINKIAKYLHVCITTWVNQLTISTHSCGQTLLETAVLTPVAVDPHDGAVLVLGARLVLDLLLDRAPEEPLE